MGVAKDFMGHSPAPEEEFIENHTDRPDLGSWGDEERPSQPQSAPATRATFGMEKNPWASQKAPITSVYDNPWSSLRATPPSPHAAVEKDVLGADSLPSDPSIARPVPRLPESRSSTRLHGPESNAGHGADEGSGGMGSRPTQETDPLGVGRL